MARRYAILLIMALSVASLHGADLSVPRLSLLTNGRLNAVGAFELATRVDIDMLVEGGSKFDAWFKLGFRNGSMEQYLRFVGVGSSLPIGATSDDLASAVSGLEASTGLSLRTVAIQVNELFGTSLELAAFVGHLDQFCSGDDFTEAFGADGFATKYRGYFYYPDGIGGDLSRRYDGLHEVYGTGIRLAMPFERLRPSLYLYQDSWLGAGYYSADARVMLDGDRVKLEAFAGASFPVSTAGTYRGGFLFYFDTGAIGDFYAQIGVPRWDPTEAFRMDLLYFMFEPRVRFDVGELVLSLFFHPAWYLQEETDESGALEFRFDLGFGEASEGSFKGGVESELAYNPNLDQNTLTMEVAPYLQTLRNGVRWDARLAVRVFPFPSPWYGMFMPTIAVSTAF
ncbi:MAG TPA: hypothetical protein PLQ29_10370 [Spirochaetales bacterium]|nr:hypothetical protein [Spirochaetales bacterium]HPG87091.1 hypothetical protein [Spirochaetales bacterium]